MPIESGAAIVMDAHVHYTATQNGETITGKMLLRQRQLCSIMPAPWLTQCGYTGLDVNFDAPANPADAGGHDPADDHGDR